MKKVLSLILVVCMTFSCLALSACEWDGIFGTTEGDPVTEILKQSVIDDYLIWSGIQSDKKPEEIDCEFFGKYGDSVAVYFHTSGAYETPTDEEVAGYTFSYPDSRVIRIWNAGKFYKMPEAHELGLISDDDVEAISVASQDIEFKEPYFIFEDKSYLDYEYYIQEKDYYIIPGVIYVVLDRGISTHKKEIDPDFFEGINVDKLEDRSPYKDYDSDELTQDKLDRIRLIYRIHLKEKTEQAVLEAVAILDRIDGIYSVYPVLGRDELDYHTTPDDEYYYDEGNGDELVNNQWGPRSIDIEKVWDFTTGSSKVRVGIIDSGIASHDDLDYNYLDRSTTLNATNLNFLGTEAEIPQVLSRDYESHGTHIADYINPLLFSGGFY